MDDMKEREQRAIPMSGQICMTTRVAHVNITNFRFVDHENGSKTEVPDFSVSEDYTQHYCLDTASSHYEVSFAYCRENGGTARHLEGSSSFELEFAKTDGENKFTWVFDGWQRLTSVSGFRNGHCADLGLYEFESVRDKVHEAKLCVDGNRIQTYIDGKLYCDHVCKSGINDISYSAVKNKDGTVIVKLVNPENLEKAVHIHMDVGNAGFREDVEVSLMAGFALKDRNSLEEPQLVVPTETNCKWDGDVLTYILPPYSLAVLRFGAR